MKFKPHDYQAYAIDFIESHEVSAVLLDMGLGKTVITLTAIEELMHDRFEVRKVLVVAPLRVARDTWPLEVKKWDHLKNLKVSVAVGSEFERRAALMRVADIYVINREQVEWLVEQSGFPFDYDMLVIDELSSFKNISSHRSKALRKARPHVKRVVGLTGTPAPNGLIDLFGEYRLLDMGQRLGRNFENYKMAYFSPGLRVNGVVVSYRPHPFAEQAIFEKISDMTISMKSTDHLKMPEKVLNNQYVEMSEGEEEVYKRLKEDLILSIDGEEVTAANAAALCGKLSQLANGAMYTDGKKTVEIHNRKLEALLDMIEAMNGKPVLIAYWFQHDYDRITKMLRKEKIKFEKLDTSESIEKWNSGELPVALIHPASAGHGLNLQQGGNTIIWFGLTWSLELYQQTNGRLWRQGQQSNTVVINHIITKGTIDERILNALRGKDVTQSELIDAVKADLGEVC